MKKTIPINKTAFIDFILIKNKIVNSYFDCYTIKYFIYCNEGVITKGDINVFSLRDIIFGKTDLCSKFIHSTSYKELSKIDYETDIFDSIQEYRKYMIKRFIGY